MKENGDPTDPVSFHSMLEELWESFAAKARLNLRKHLQTADPASSEWCERDKQFHRLKMEAQRELLGFLLRGGRWWIADGENWKRPPPKVLLSRIERSSPDEPWGVEIFLDRVEVEAATRMYEAEPSAAHQVSSQVAPKGKRGRPEGTGPHSKSDLPLLDEMAELIAADPSITPWEAALIVAPRAGGTPDILNRAKRLERKFNKRMSNGS